MLICKQLGNAVALKHGIPINNPLITLVHDPDRKIDDDDMKAAQEELDALTPLELMRRIARAVMIKPRYEELEDLIENDLFIMAAISNATTSMPIMQPLFEQFMRVPEGMAPANFRKTAEVDPEAEPASPRVSI